MDRGKERWISVLHGDATVGTSPDDSDTLTEGQGQAVTGTVRNMDLRLDEEVRGLEGC